MEVSITNEDAIFFLDMIRSSRSPNHIPKLHTAKPYIKILKNKDSVEYKRFVQVYSCVRNILSEREKYVVDKVYIDGATLEGIGEGLNITRERVRQIRVKAEYRMGTKIADKFEINVSPLSLQRANRRRISKSNEIEI